MTARYEQIRIGDTVEYDNVDCVVESVVFDPNRPATVHLRSIDGVRYHVLGSALADSVAAIPRDPQAQVRAAPLQLDGIGDDAKADALELLEHMREIETGYRSGIADDALAHEPRLEYEPTSTTVSSRVAAKVNELRLTERQTWTLWTRYCESGVYGLVDRRKVRHHNPLAGVDPRIIEAIKTVGGREILDSTGTYNRLRRRVQRQLDTTYGVGTVALPSAPTFNRYVKELTAGQHTTGGATTRRTTAAQPDRSFTLMAATRPGEVVMIDSTRLDVFAFDPDTGASHAVELSLTLDLFTRSLLSWRLTPVGTKAVDAALMLADILTPEPMRPGWPDTVRYRALQVPLERMIGVDERIEQAAARPVILPETIIVDHGKIYISQAFRDACARLGISLQLARKGQGTDKANVERLFGTVRTQFAEHIAGYKGPNVAHRGADPESRARWTVGELEEFFAEYVVCVYQRQHHSGLTLPGWPELKLSPNDAYNEAIERTGVIMIPPNPQLYFELMPTEWCTIRHDGVRVKGLQYRSEVLYRYKHTTSGYAAEKGKWPIKYDPRDRNQVFFQDPADGTWSAVPWIHRYDDTRPFTDRTLDFVKRHLVERGGSPRDEAEIAEALTALQNKMDTPAELIGKERQRAIRDAERGRVAARDRNSGGLPNTPLRAVPNDTSPAAAPDDFELGDLDGFGAFEPWSTGSR
jgi:putative transposase